MFHLCFVKNSTGNGLFKNIFFKKIGQVKVPQKIRQKNLVVKSKGTLN
jgi:hypothetical protein